LCATCKGIQKWAYPAGEIFFQGNLKKRDHFEDLNVDRWINLKGSLTIE
jgi:hypothetical protein